MSRNSINMLSGVVSGTTVHTSGNTPGDSYYGFTDGIHTVAIYPNNFLGSLELQATLAETPGANDWFNITLKNGTTASYSNANDVDAYTFTGNFLYLRVKITPQPSNSGSIDKILLNY